MTMHPVERKEIPADTRELGEMLLPQNSPYRIVGDHFPDLVRDEDFAALFSDIGGPAISPAILAMVTVFQMMEKLPDRLAAASVALRIDWKYALHLPLDDPGFHFTNLSHFRKRLLDHEADYIVFDRLVRQLVELGFVKRRGKQRTDSSHVLGLVTRLSRLELVWETLRVSLEAIERLDNTWLERVVPESFLERYLVKRSSYRLTDRKAATELRQAGADGFWWLRQLETGPAEWQDLPEVQTLRTVWAQQFESDEEGGYGGPRTKLEAHGTISSPHEPEARYRKKRGGSWLGYMAQVTETAEGKGKANFITDVGLTDAQLDDRLALPGIQSRLAQRGLLPSQQIVDQNYISGTQLATSQKQGIELMGLVQEQSGPEGFKQDDFQIDLANGRATCPAGQISSKLYPRQNADGSMEYQFRFGNVCASCSHRGTCTSAKGGRTLTYLEHYPLLQKRRAAMETDDFQQLMKLRPAVEGTISQLMRCGARRARYRGWRRANLQLIFTATAINLRRLCQVWDTDRSPSPAT